MKHLFFISLLFLVGGSCFAQYSNTEKKDKTFLPPETHNKYRVNLRLGDFTPGTNETGRLYHLAHLSERSGYHLSGNIDWLAEPQLSRHPNGHGNDKYSYRHVLSPYGQDFIGAIICGFSQWCIDKSYTQKPYVNK